LDPPHHHFTRLQNRKEVMAPSAADSIATVLAKLEELAGKLDESNLKADDTNRRLQQLAEEQTTVTA